MDASERAPPAAAYAAHGKGVNAGCARLDTDPQRACKARTYLACNGLMRPDGATLTSLGSRWGVLTGRVFDTIHPGHIHAFNAARKMGNVLAVVVGADETTRKMKRRPPLHDQETRQRLADLCAVGRQGDMFKTT